MDRTFFKFVQLATCAVFLGRAWQHWRWDAPYRALLWDEEWMSRPVSTLLGMNWEVYITNMEVDMTIQSGIQAMGVFYFCCALIALFLPKLPVFFRYILLVGGSSLLFLAFLYGKERFFSIAQVFEYTLQFGSPFLFVYLLKHPTLSSSLILLIKVAIALTFTAHGLYAVGYYPRPVHFMEMTMNILGVGEDVAIQFLNTAGILDFIISLGIFLPWRWSKYCLLYAAFWGLSTTIARVWAYFDWAWLTMILEQWLHESVMRFPHFLIPLGLFIYLHRNYKANKRPTSSA